MTLKCCAVLGTHFSLSLLKSVLPHRNSSDIHQSVRVMIKEQLLECGGTFGLGNVCSNKDCSEIGAKAADQVRDLKGRIVFYCKSSLKNDLEQNS